MLHKISLPDPICPSCGQPKEDSEKKDMSKYPLCFYCYFRGRHSVSKMFILYVLDEHKRPVTIKQLINLMNNHPINDGRRIWNYTSVKYMVWRLTTKKNKLLTKNKKKIKGKKGRPEYIYSIGKRKGVKYLERYLQKWDTGSFISLKPFLFNTLYNMRPENRYKHIAISDKIKKGECGRFDYIFSEGLTNERYHTSVTEKIQEKE